MKVKVVKIIGKIDNDDDYMKIADIVEQLDGRANALIDISNGDIKDPLKEVKRTDRQRDKLIQKMRDYRKLKGWDDK